MTAIDFHNMVSEQFARRYGSTPEFAERLRFWDNKLALLPRVELAVDLGCGPGILTDLLLTKASRVIASDGSSKMLTSCRDRNGPSVEYVQADLEQSDLSFMAGANLVVLSSVLEYISDPVGLMARVARVAAPDLVVMASIPNPRAWYRSLERLSYRLVGRPRYLPLSVSRPSAADLAVDGLKVTGVERYATPKFVGGVSQKILGDERTCTLTWVHLVRDRAAGSSDAP